MKLAGESAYARRDQVQLFYNNLCQKCARDTKLSQHYTDLQEHGFTRGNLGELGHSNPQFEAANPSAWDAARSWDRSKNLWVFGPVGTGKSYLARCLLKRVCDSSFEDVGETNMRSLPAAYARFDKGGGVIDRWKEAQVLLIDDLDKARWNENSIMALFDLLEDRHPDTRSGDRRTIVTSNVALPVLYESLQKVSPSNSSYVRGIFDRLNPCQTVELKGASHRMQRDASA
tara:strand:- start:1282 stop:1971 length:690 start_codon:yes stop_codon:yes gene_type:complete